MNWAAIAFDWNQVRAFLATAEEGSLSAAARVLKLTQPTVGRQVTALEEDLGIVLFERVGRSVALTDAGRELLKHVRTMADAAGRISLYASGQSDEIAGKVRVTASDVFSAHLLPPMLADLRNKAPALEIDVVAANDIRDILRREADIAIRHIRPEQPDLIARKVIDATAHFYAARSYLDAHGEPLSKAEMSAHRFVHVGDPTVFISHLKPLGFDLEPGNFPTGSASGVVAWELARQGLGIIVMADEVGRIAPDMEILLPDMPPITFPIWLVTHRELHNSRRIRLVFDHLAEALAKLAGANQHR